MRLHGHVRAAVVVRQQSYFYVDSKARSRLHVLRPTPRIAARKHAALMIVADSTTCVAVSQASKMQWAAARVILHLGNPLRAEIPRIP